MSPLRDQDGRETDEVRADVALSVTEILVRHDSVECFDAEGRKVMVISRPRHPGAGLSVEYALERVAERLAKYDPEKS